MTKGPGADEGRFSGIFREVASQSESERISLGALLEGLGHRSFGMLLLVLAVPAWIPVLPPGGSSIFGLAILILSVQLLLGRPRPWLPDRLLRRSFRRTAFETLAVRADPYLRWIERYSRPRQLWTFEKIPSRVTAAFAVLLSLALCVPLPMTNSGPAASLAVMALGLIERDGLLVQAGIVLGVLSIAVMAAFWGGAYLGLRWLLGG